eukprot:GILI01015694.1.p1 GENE.GILI01015694.1~~GILI01015694.1.p1  ORF type:complete len:741 (-),score=114.21 GILI01015694.1:111-2141(-)
MSPFMNQIKTWVYRLLTGITIVMSLCIILWTLPRYYDKQDNAFEIIILLSVIVFTIDWVLRMATSPATMRTLLAPLNIIDIVGLLPFWINYANLFPQGVSHWVLLLRILRLIRGLFSLNQYTIVIKLIEESTEVVALMVMMFAIVLPSVGTAIHYAERGEYNDASQRWERTCRLDDNCTLEVSPFQDAVDGMWFAATTITTLGLGDVYPVSDIGYIIGGLTMIAAVFMIAFPIMILAVNFETEKDKVTQDKQRQQARLGRFLQDLQREHTRVESEEAVQVAARHRTAMNTIKDENEPEIQKSNPNEDRIIHFRANEHDVYRQAVLYNETEVRYSPILAVMRDPLDPNLIGLTQNANKPYQFRFKVALGTREAETAAKRAMNAVLPTTGMKVTTARNFHVLEVHYALLKPDHQCEFLRNVRLLRAYHDNVAPMQTSVSGTLELENLNCTMDAQRIRDFGYALQRCRLRITATVVYHDPISYEVPIFLDMLRATNLVKELTARPRGLTFCTREQVYDLVSGIHHLFDIKDPTTDAKSVIINVEQIALAVVKAIIDGYSMQLPDVLDTKPEDFFFPAMRETALAQMRDTNPNRKIIEYHGIFTNRLARRPEERSWMNVLLGKEALWDKVEDSKDKDTNVLCTVTVKCVTPSIQMSTVSLQCSSSSPFADRFRRESAIEE